MNESANAEVVAALRRTGATYEPDRDALIGLSGADRIREPEVIQRFRYRTDGSVLPPSS